MQKKFKVESEDGKFDLYVENADGEHTIKKGDFSVKATLVAWDVSSEEAASIPCFLDLPVKQAA